MKIVQLETFLTKPSISPDGWASVKPLLFVKLVTDSGITGWGEAYTLQGRERAMQELILSLGRELIAKTMATPNAWRRYAQREFADKRMGIDFFCALSALELALWDCHGKNLDAPVHQLLGGPLRTRIPLYANLYSDFPRSVDELIAHARQLRGEGFFAFKIYPMLLPTLTEAEDCVRQMRAAMGPDIDIMIDLNALDDVYTSIQAGSRFAPYDPFWFEEPVSSDDLMALRHVRSNLKLRLVSGERHGGILCFRELLEQQVADVLNPDIAGCGGILEFLKIAALAEAYSAGVTPHNYNSLTVGMAAMLHVSALIPNLLYGEYYPNLALISACLANAAFTVKDGYASVPDASGLGIDMNEDELRRISHVCAL